MLSKIKRTLFQRFDEWTGAEQRIRKLYSELCDATDKNNELNLKVCSLRQEKYLLREGIDGLEKKLWAERDKPISPEIIKRDQKIRELEDQVARLGRADAVGLAVSRLRYLDNPSGRYLTGVDFEAAKRLAGEIVDTIAGLSNVDCVRSVVTRNGTTGVNTLEVDLRPFDGGLRGMIFVGDRFFSTSGDARVATVLEISCLVSQMLQEKLVAPIVASLAAVINNTETKPCPPSSGSTLTLRPTTSSPKSPDSGASSSETGTPTKSSSPTAT